jgi:hypothetical protein
MLSYGFISEIYNYKTLALGGTEKIFLHIISKEPTSVYRISAGLKNGSITIGDSMLITGINSMAYKNVHKRIKRLCALGLIEEIHGNFKRNAKMYALTPRGLFERLLDDFPIPPDIVYLYRNYPVIETLIYQYFELETIENFSDFALVELKRYLKKCCDEILKMLAMYRYNRNFFEKWRESHIPMRENDDEFTSFLDDTIKSEVKNFVFKIVNRSKDEDPYRNNPDDSKFFPRQALLKDKKFMRLLQEIKKDFDNGCKNFL